MSRVQGQRGGFCRQCHSDPKDDKPWYHHDPVRALYIRDAKKGFYRIGWFFEECGHMELNEEIEKEINLRREKERKRIEWFERMQKKRKERNIEKWNSRLKK